MITLNAYFYSLNAATNKSYGRLKNEWYSDDCHEIGYINKNSNYKIVFDIDSDCGIPGGSREKFKNIIDVAIKKWCNLLDLEFYVDEDSVLYDKYTIRINVISRENFEKMELSDPANSSSSFDRSSVIGIVNRDDFKIVGQVLAYKTDFKEDRKEFTVNIYRINKSTIYIIWDGSSSSKYRTDYFDNDTWIKLISHEFGHSIGYRGHNNNEDIKSIMYSKGSELISWEINGPNEYDISHLLNVYKSDIYNELP